MDTTHTTYIYTVGGGTETYAYSTRASVKDNVATDFFYTKDDISGDVTTSTTTKTVTIDTY
jgi:hypothetical protein